ncbi:GH1 family beta-glucosidase [Nocardioides sp. NPDC101246]|uniref:GH1 family beta-glucosidase n=1 Tax=Nocardioides sp. NPDC101246 TaxID=3364336 RepID=UPI0037FEDB4A
MSELPGTSLPTGFRFGASTAAYQIEGAADEDGRGPSVWDTFCAEPGRIIDQSSGEVACDHYHRLDEDLALMARLGLDAYRFSISWSRVLPTGSGEVNKQGLDFYDRLVDGLLERGIAPMATLFHWDTPQVLQDAHGGWLSRKTAQRFGEYAAVVADRLADRVAHWCPVNEPNVVTVLGHALGIHAPGQALVFDALPAGHHLLLGHGLAVQALRAAGARSIGTATNHMPVWPATDSEEDRATAGLLDTLWNHSFADPVLLGSYPEDLAPLFPVQDGDLEVISAPLDFYGLNYYNPTAAAAAAEGSANPIEQPPIPGYPTTDFGWPVIPDGLHELLTAMHQRYPEHPPFVITENGASYNTAPGDGDADRIAYLDLHLTQLERAVADGIDVTGYYCWSLMDNFEWAEGYTQRFGLVHIDYDTLVRTPRPSFDWYASVIAAHKARR